MPVANRMASLLSLALILAGCGGTDAPTKTLRLAFTGLTQLQSDFAYEGWLIIDGKPRSTGRFNADASGALVGTAGAVLANGDFTLDAALSADAARATNVVVTIEKANVPGPSKSHYFAGALSGVTATLTVAAPQALGSDFASAAGKFILAAPTDSAPAHNLSGLWFIDLTSGSPAAGLTLPALPAGWVYEGWALIGNTPVSTGRFTAASGADQAAPYSGTNSGPAFPGEDFLHNAPSGVTFPTNLQGGKAVISIEPDPDDSPAPFALKPLLANIAAAAADHTTYALANQAATFPTGTAAIR